MPSQEDFNRYKRLVKIIKREIPGFEIKYKNEVWHQRLLGWILFFNPSYMKRFTSVFGAVVYFPTREFVNSNYSRAFKVLGHEYGHLWDGKILSFGRFEIMYAFPQVLSLFSIIAIFSSLWWLCLLFLAPLPAYFRAALEMRGYAVNMAVNYWKHGSITQETRDNIAAHFRNPTYFFMWPFKGQVRKWINEVEREIYQKQSGGVLWSDPKVYVDVYNALTGDEAAQ